MIAEETDAVAAVPEAPERRRRRRWRWRWAQGALLSLPLAFYAVAAWSHRWMTDDGFINLRVVRQIEAGHGPVFNVGERVEAVTSPLWIALVTVGDLLTPLRVEWVVVVLGVLTATAGLALVTAGAARLARLAEPDQRAVLLPAGVLIPACVYAFWVLASGGLEGGLTFAWEGACLFVLAGWAARRDARLGTAGAVLLGLGWVFRPDLVILSVLLLGVVLAGEWRHRSMAGRLALAATVLAVPAAYQVFRMGYYGALVPNTAFAKTADRALWGRGWDYLSASIRPFWLWLPLVVLVVVAYPVLLRRLARADVRRGQLVAGAFVLAAVLMATYMVRVGGDYLPARLLLPSIFALVAPVGVVTLKPDHAAPLAVLVPWATVCAVSLRPDAPYLTTALGLNPQGITVERVLPASVGDFSWFTGSGVYWEDVRLPVKPSPDIPQPTIAQFGIGMAGFAVGPDVYVFDELGLADPVTSRFVPMEGGVPGHEKRIPPAWAAARLVAPGQPVSADLFPRRDVVATPDLIATTKGAEFERQVDTVRTVLRCRPVHDLFLAAHADLTPGRFLANIAHSVRSYGTTIPPDPDEARRALC